MHAHTRTHTSLQTQPFSLILNAKPEGLAAWEETLLVDEELDRLLALDALLLFEVQGVAAGPGGDDCGWVFNEGAMLCWWSRGCKRRWCCVDDAVLYV